MAQAENTRINSQRRVDIYNTRARLKKISEQKLKGAMVRSKVRWVEHGEKTQGTPVVRSMLRKKES